MNTKSISYKHIIFNVDGTLLDTEYAILHSLQDTISDILQKIIETEKLTFALGIPGEVALKQLGFKQTECANQLWNENLMKYNLSIKLFDGIPEVLQQLQEKGYKLGIITSKNRQELANDFEPHGITHYFDTIICVDDSPRPKPHPDPILTYLAKTNAAPKEVLYIGDTVYDYQCAHQAGVDFGLVMWGNTSTENISANHVYLSPSEILKAIIKQI